MGLGVAAGLGLLAGGAAYASRWPTSQIFGRTLTSARRPGELALTFDDGPNPVWTPRLLDVLASHQAHATFFMLGRYAAVQPELVRRVAAAGHLIGCHAWSHQSLACAPARQIREELEQSRQTLEQITGDKIGYFRPPFGARRPAVLRISRQLGLEPVLWSAMTNDWAEPETSEIVARLSAKVERLERRGRAAVIVLHDGSDTNMEANRAPSVSAADELLQRFQPTHRFVRVDAWASEA